MTTQAQPVTRHPLDPLSAEEIESASRIVRDERHLENVRFISIGLHEPPKEAVLDIHRKRAYRPRSRGRAARPLGREDL